MDVVYIWSVFALIIYCMLLCCILQNYKNLIARFIQWSKEKKKEVDTVVFEWVEDGVGVRVTFCAEDIMYSTCFVALCFTKTAKMQF